MLLASCAALLLAFLPRVQCDETAALSSRWSYLALNADGGMLPGGGTYITYISPDKRNFSIVLETMTLEVQRDVLWSPFWLPSPCICRRPLSSPRCTLIVHSKNSRCIRNNPSTPWKVTAQNVTFKLAGPLPKAGGCWAVGCV